MRSFSKLLLLLPLVFVAPAFLVGCGGPGATVETTDDAAAEAEEAASIAADAELGVGDDEGGEEE